MAFQGPKGKLRLVLFAALLFVTACVTDVNSVANRITTANERAFPRTYLRLLARARIDSAFSLLGPDLRTDSTRTVLAQVAMLLMAARLDSARLIGVQVWNNTRFGGNSRDVSMSYEMPTTAPGWLTSGVATRHVGSSISVIGITARLIPEPVETLNRFTLSGKSAIHYAWLTLALAVPLVTITVAVVVARARGMPRRWLWVFASLVASPVFIINWTTGKIGIQTVSFLFFGGAATSTGPGAPWLVSFAFPIGAAVAYLKLSQWRQATAPSPGSGGTAVAV